MGQIKMMSRIMYLSMSMFSFGLVGILIASCGYTVPLKSPRPAAPPAPDMARVYFINTGSFHGEHAATDTTTYILKETELIGYLDRDEAAYVDLPAGEHFFMSVAANREGVYAKLAGGKTYYLRLVFEPGPQTAVGGETVKAFWDPIVPGDIGWSSRHDAVDHARLVALNQKKAEGWNLRWSERNQQWFLQFKKGRKQYVSLNPDQGE